MFPSTIAKAIASRIDAHYPLLHTKELSYGTSGIRTKGELLPPVSARLVFIAVLRAWSCGINSLNKFTRQKGSGIGFIITASHNPFEDNGFKIIDSDGGMLKMTWEVWCNKAVNAESGEELLKVLESCMIEENITFPQSHQDPFGFILFGRDTRATGAAILNAAKEMLNTIPKISCKDFGMVTTPELHYMVLKFNSVLERGLPPYVSANLYYENHLIALDRLMSLSLNGALLRPHDLVIDVANGVGYYGLRRLISYAETFGDGNFLKKYFNIVLLNTETEQAQKLNHLCGAEYVHKKGRPSEEMIQWALLNDKEANPAHYYALDGDADRLIGLYFDSRASDNGKQWYMLDGDRMAILFALLLRKWLGSSVIESLDVGIVHTGYTNGAACRYIKEKLNLKSYVTASGVKNLHPVARNLDIGIYFEPNGHGTVLIRDSLKEELANRLSVQQAESVALVLETFPLLASQVCGDAIADILLCEIALNALQLSPLQWLEIYDARPSIQSTISVPDPSVITNTKDETRAITPKGLQEEIDAIVNSVEDEFLGKDGHQGVARAFVRPSGTEPIVRIYAEASTEQACEVLEQRVRAAIVKFCT